MISAPQLAVAFFFPYMSPKDPKSGGIAQSWLKGTNVLDMPPVRARLCGGCAAVVPRLCRGCAVVQRLEAVPARWLAAISDGLCSPTRLVRHRRSCTLTRFDSLRRNGTSFLSISRSEIEPRLLPDSAHRRIASLPRRLTGLLQANDAANRQYGWMLEMWGCCLLYTSPSPRDS